MLDKSDNYGTCPKIVALRIGPPVITNCTGRDFLLCSRMFLIMCPFSKVRVICTQSSTESNCNLVTVMRLMTRHPGSKPVFALNACRNPTLKKIQFVMHSQSMPKFVPRKSGTISFFHRLNFRVEFL